MNAALTEGQVGQCPGTTEPECSAFDQRFTATMDRFGNLFVEGPFSQLRLSAIQNKAIDQFRETVTGTSFTEWRVRRLQCEEPIVSQIINGVYFFDGRDRVDTKCGPAANYLLKLAEEGGILEDMSEADRQWRLAREADEAESDRQSRDGYQEMERFFLSGGK